jgi:hypothetical protein
MARATRADGKWLTTAIVIAFAVVFFGIAAQSLSIAVTVGGVMAVVFGGLRAGEPADLDGADRLQVFVRGTLRMVGAVVLVVVGGFFALLFVLFMVCLAAAGGQGGGFH